MRRLGLALVVLLAAAAPAARPEGAGGAAIMAAIGAGALNISTQPSEFPLLTWASWTEGTPDAWVTRLALVRGRGRLTRITWAVRRADGYGAVLHPTPWQAEGRAVLILQYQFGAAYTRMELYAARPDGRADRLDSLEGAWIDVASDGADQTLRAHDSADLQGAPRCRGWDQAARRLVALACK